MHFSSVEIYVILRNFNLVSEDICAFKQSSILAKQVKFIVLFTLIDSLMIL